VNKKQKKLLIRIIVAAFYVPLYLISENIVTVTLDSASFPYVNSAS